MRKHLLPGRNSNPGKRREILRPATDQRMIPERTAAVLCRRISFG